jgi:hypothetical protein
VTERLPTFALEAITDAATCLSRMSKECQYPFLREDAERIVANLTQIIDGQAALGQRQRLPDLLPFAMGETS